MELLENNYPIENEETVKNFSKDRIPQKLTFCDDNYSAQERSNALVLITEWEMFRKSNILKIKELIQNFCILDGRNKYDFDCMRSNGFKYNGIDQ